MRPKHSPTTKRRKGGPSFCASSIFFTQVGETALSDARLGFSSFGVVKHYQRHQPLPHYPAARSRPSQVPSTGYFAAGSVTALDSRAFSASGVPLAARESGFLNARFSHSGCPLQQWRMVKDISHVCRCQQNFLQTPSESISLFSCMRLEIDGPSEKRVIDVPADLTAIREVWQ